MGLTLLALFFQAKGVGHKGRIHIDKRGVRRLYHSIKCKVYRSIFGKIDIPRACYWAKGESEIYPLDAELNLPSTENSYVLQEWAAVLGAEEAYEKAARFLETILRNKVLQATLKGKDIAAKRLMVEMNKRDPERQKQGVALVDGDINCVN